jgi:uncharacterized membrane protein YbhN (UPF0104 family)
VLLLIGFLSVFVSKIYSIFGFIIIFLYIILPAGLYYNRKKWKDFNKINSSRLIQFVHKIIEAFPENPGKTFRILLWTLLNWLSKLIAYGWIIAVVSKSNLSTGILGSVTGELSSVLPFHGFAGAGTYEAGVLASLIPVGVSTENAINAAVNLHLIILSISLFTALIALIPLNALKKTISMLKVWLKTKTIKRN